jgi:hypothetical protein
MKICRCFYVEPPEQDPAMYDKIPLELLFIIPHPPAKVGGDARRPDK